IRNVSETIQGLRPDAVVLMPLPTDATEMMDRSPELAARALPEEVVVAYKEAKALPNCTVVCDGLPLRTSLMQMIWIRFKQPKMNADIEKRMKEIR
ncbi:hypothetical protein AAVH_41579, partial [Aphelenchoides avenae]